MFGTDKTREFQSGMDKQSLRRGREADRLNLRRKQREKTLQRKRRQLMSSTPASQENDDSTDSLNINSSKSRLASTSNINPETVTVDKLASYSAALKSSDVKQQQQGLMCIRILLSKAESEGPFESIVRGDTVPILLSFFKSDDNLKVQFEAAWAVTNLCSGSRDIVDYVCKYDAISAFEGLLNTTKHFEIMEQAVWGLGNIAGECQQYRNQIIKDGIFQNLLSRIEAFLKSNNYSLCRNMVWCLSNLLRYDGDGPCKESPDAPPPDLCPWDHLKGMVPVFERLLREMGKRIDALKKEITAGKRREGDPDYSHCLQCCQDTLWAVHNSQLYMEYAPRCSYIMDLFQSELVDIIIAFMQMDSISLLSPSLRIMGTLLCEDDDAVSVKVLEKGYLKVAMLNLSCRVRSIRKEVCWTLSNIAGCEKEIAVQILQFENGELLKTLTKTCLFDDDQVKKEAGWVLANIVALSDPEIIHFMVKRGVIGALRAVMKTASVKKPLITCMEAFDVIMSHTKARDGGEYDYISKVEESGCCEIFDILQSGVDDNDKVYTTSYELVQKYWPEDGGQPWQPYSGLSMRGQETPWGRTDAQDITDAVHIEEQVVNQDENEEDEDEDLMQPTQTGNQFGFGIQSNIQQNGGGDSVNVESQSISDKQSNGNSSGNAYQF